MQEIIMERVFGNFDQSKLEELEKKLGEKLPEDYVEFLKKYNGGYGPKKNTANFVDSYGDNDGAMVDTFYGVFNTKNEYYGIATNPRFLMKRIPKDCITIASLVGGDELCLVFKGPNKGKIYFWDHEMEADPDQGEKPDYSNMSFIANSFSEFIDMLYEFELPDDE